MEEEEEEAEEEEMDYDEEDQMIEEDEDVEGHGLAQAKGEDPVHDSLGFHSMGGASSDYSPSNCEDAAGNDDFESGPGRNLPKRRKFKQHTSAFSSSVLDAFHEFIYAFFSEYESDTGPEDVVNPVVKFNHPLECYYALRALRRDGTFRPVSLITQLFAQAKYICRCVAWYEARRHRHEYDGSILQKCLADDNGERLQCGRSVLVVSQFRKGLLDLYEKMCEHIKTLFHGRRPGVFYPAGVQKTGIVPENKAPFVNDPLFLIRILFDDTKLGLARIAPDGTLDWNHSAIKEVLHEITLINQLLAVLTYITAGPDPRAAEFLAHKIANGMRGRTVFRHFEDIYMVIRRVKGENLQGHESFISTKLNPRLHELFDLYFTVIRPVEVILASALDPAFGRLYTTYAWVWDCRMVKTPDFMPVFRDSMCTFCGVFHCTVSIFRHLNVELGRIFLGPQYVTQNFSGFDILADQRSHSAKCNMLPSLTSNTLLMYGLVSGHWHDMLGFGLGPVILEPIQADTIKDAVAIAHSVLTETMANVKADWTKDFTCIVSREIKKLLQLWADNVPEPSTSTTASSSTPHVSSSSAPTPSPDASAEALPTHPADRLRRSGRRLPSSNGVSLAKHTACKPHHRPNPHTGDDMPTQGPTMSLRQRRSRRVVISHSEDEDESFPGFQVSRHLPFEAHSPSVALSLGALPPPATLLSSSSQTTLAASSSSSSSQTALASTSSSLPSTKTKPRKRSLQQEDTNLPAAKKARTWRLLGKENADVHGLPQIEVYIDVEPRDLKRRSKPKAPVLQPANTGTRDPDPSPIGQPSSKLTNLAWPRCSTIPT
ncbi:ATP-dependent DNA helicase [Salix suchowensis]|nr:ATP-dependent DNA helicase [Salix suchowensis]